MAEFLEQILIDTNAMRAPLAGDAPAGADVALEPEFERIKGEIDKLTSLSGGQVDWRAVVQGAEGLLATKTKDLRLAFWMACGSLERAGWHGFARSLVVCRSLVTDFWDGMHPARPKARSNIAAWFGERANPQLVELRLDLETGDAVRACEQLLNEIDAAFSEKLGEAYGGMGSVRNTMRARVRDIPAPPPPAAAKEETAASGSSDWADDDAPPPSTDRNAGGSIALSTRAEDAADTSRKCGEALVALARAMRAADPSRAWAYRLHRTGIWLPFDSPPRPDAPLPAPPEAVRASTYALFSSARFAELLSAAEEASAIAPLWLDAHRYAAIATERLGLAYADAREAIGRDVADLVRRWPFVIEGAFEDGTPHASQETREWLTAEAARWQLVTGRGESTAKSEDQKLRKRFEEAHDLVARGHHLEGLALATELARRAADPRARFRAELAVSELAISVAAFDVARPLLDGLFAISEAQRLETWEPALPATLYVRLVKCLDHEIKEGREGAAERRAQVFDRLCRVDPAAALKTRTGGQSHPNGSVLGLIGQAFGVRAASAGNGENSGTSSTRADASEGSSGTTSSGRGSAGGTSAGEARGSAGGASADQAESEWADD